MSLSATIRTLADQAKHAPDTLDAHDVRAVCLQALEVLDLFAAVTHIGVSAYNDDGPRLLTVKAQIDDTARPYSTLAGVSDQ